MYNVLFLSGIFVSPVINQGRIFLDKISILVICCNRSLRDLKTQHEIMNINLGDHNQKWITKVWAPNKKQFPYHRWWNFLGNKWPIQHIQSEFLLKIMTWSFFKGNVDEFLNSIHNLTYSRSNLGYNNCIIIKRWYYMIITSNYKKWMGHKYINHPYKNQYNVTLWGHKSV